VPVNPDTGRMTKDYQEICGRFAELGRLWRDLKTDAVEQLRESAALKKNIYSETIVDSMVREMDLYVSGYDPLLLPDSFEKFTCSRISASVKKDPEAPQSLLYTFCDRYLSLVRNFEVMLNNYFLFIRHELFSYIEKELAGLKGERPERSFDDLIKDVHSALRGPGGGILSSSVSGRYRAALIDEFQDTDQLQFEIFSRLFNNKKSVLFLIGDPKQAIYRFRGADIFSYIEASASMDKRYTLLNNWRSREELIRAVNHLFSGCDNPFNFDRIEFSSVRPGKDDQADIFYEGAVNSSGMEIILASSEEPGDLNAGEASDIILSNIAAKISEIIDPVSQRCRLGSRAVNPGDIAVLVRKHSLARELRARLRALNIPSVIHGAETVFSTREALELYYILNALSEPDNERSVKAAMSTDMMGLKAGDFAALSSGEESGMGSAFAAVADRFYQYREIWHSSGVMPMFNAIIQNEKIEERLFSSIEGERRITNIHHLVEMLHRMERRGKLSVNELVIWFRKGIQDMPDDDEYLTRLEREDFAVKIQTIHSSKGLEFPVVFCPIIPESSGNIGESIVYHDPDENNRPVMYIGNGSLPERVNELFQDEEIAENMRLAYVALTRAKSKCFVYTAKTKKNFYASTPFRLFYKNRNDIRIISEKPDFDEYRGVLQDIALQSEGSVKFRTAGRAAASFYKPERGMESNLSSRAFTGNIRSDWRIWSYSSLVWHDASFDGRDRDAAEAPPVETPVILDRGIFSFPSGVKAGLFMHEVFENIDFTWPMESIAPVIAEKSVKYGFEDKWLAPVAGMVSNVISSDLDSDGIRLSSLETGARLNELEFYIPASAPSAGELRGLLVSHGGFSEAAAQGIRDASSIRGFLKGFMDMVFYYEGRYYILDWKSNNLGGSQSMYSSDRIAEEMGRHNYYLQYHIYTLALHRYLALRMGDAYSYDKHFGGVYYLFVRGMGQDEKGSGIFYHKPDYALVEALDIFFKSAAE